MIMNMNARRGCRVAPGARPEGRVSLIAVLAAALLAAAPGIAQVPRPAPSLVASPMLTVEQAIERALGSAPSLGAGEAAVAMARAGRVQAGVRPPDTVEVEAENFAGTGNYSVLEQAEITGTYSRLLERGGKRVARSALADRDIDVAQAGLAVRRVEIAVAVERAFAAALIAEANVTAAAAQLEIERVLAREAERRVKAYKDPLFVRTRSQARVSEAELGHAAATRLRDAALEALAAWWGGRGADVVLDGGDFLRPQPVGPQAEELAGADLALAEAEIARADAAITLERTRSTRDYTVGGGLRYLRQTDDVALLARVTIPLTKPRHNRGNVDRALAERERVALDAEATRFVRSRQVATLRREAESARLEVMGIANEVLPKLDLALAQVREGYNRGGFSFADVQDQARAVFEARRRMVDALARHHNARVELDRLTGRFARLVTQETRP